MQADQHKYASYAAINMYSILVLKDIWQQEPEDCTVKQ